jgi:hypothetical protein
LVIVLSLLSSGPDDAANAAATANRLANDTLLSVFHDFRFLELLMKSLAAANTTASVLGELLCVLLR